MKKPRWDIFCKIVDNFGDIGVCWRLAGQLHVEHDLQVRLWIDDLSAAQAIIPSLNIEKNQQICDGISIEKWDKVADFSQAADVVIEAFACGLPEPYLTAMQGQKSKWVNLEYLSAESWVDAFHGKPSPQNFLKSANGLTRYFYFPGFTEATGGLIREHSIAELNQQNSQINNNLKISLFCYQNAPIKDLLNALQQYLLSPQNIPAEAGYSCVKANIHTLCMYVPKSSILPKVAEFFGKDTIDVGERLTKNNLTVEILPFLSQDDYDALLASCDINFVRGEDSWIRAIWAGKPFIWQPYLQTDNTHIKKLKAFIDMFYANYEQKEMLWKAHEYWSAGHALQSDFKPIWKNYMNALQSTQFYTKTQSQNLATQTDLATKLVIFCNALNNP